MINFSLHVCECILLSLLQYCFFWLMLSVDYALKYAFFNWIYFEPIFVILLQNLTFLNQCFCHAFEFSHYISDIYINLLTLSRHWVDLISLLHYFLITVYSSVWPLIIFKRKALNVFFWNFSYLIYSGFWNFELVEVSWLLVYSLFGIFLLYFMYLLICLYLSVFIFSFPYSFQLVGFMWIFLVNCLHLSLYSQLLGTGKQTAITKTTIWEQSGC